MEQLGRASLTIRADNRVKKQNEVPFRGQGILTNETRCLRCETVTAKDETFLDLSLDIYNIEHNTSITSCLNPEDKFFCDKGCCRLVPSANINI
ncbi:hypothetical protein M8C21_033180 [Ambrosia artemisiifolia]|uniref:Uncharacterized protein n=1 Tax=Ambrosia artemisiifolia TaxID=4212 RepID=A0AAD5G817_AMBAR|nr:hypothetical protein M8C21_033180 [Ambrosia artemisiifolia]